MRIDYEKVWSDMVGLIQSGDGDKAKKIFDEIVELAKRYEDLRDS